MPFTSDEFARIGKYTLDYFLKNNPIDQIAMDRPFLKKMLSRKKTFAGGKEFIVIQLRSSYQSNFQFFDGADTVTYNNRDTVEQAQYPYTNIHDGYQIDEDRLRRNGITITDSKRGSASESEVFQLTNMLKELNEVLNLGFKEKMSAYLQLDGSSSAKALVGLDALVTLQAAPSATGQQVIGGLDRFTWPWWNNYKKTGLSNTTVIDEMEKGFRSQSIHGGGPTDIFVGGDFMDAYRANSKATGNVERFMTVPQKGGVEVDPSITGLNFHGIPLQFCPEWESNFDGMVNPATPWAKRCYMLNLNNIRLQVMQGNDMQSRQPQRPYDRYVLFQAVTWTGGVTMDMASNQGVYALT